MRTRIFMAAASALSLTVAGCAGTDEMQAQSLAQWKAYCAKQGKQFLWKDTIEQNGMVMNSVQLEGRCVGPKEKGYRPPEPPDDSP
jgi:hypothetical protein